MYSDDGVLNVGISRIDNEHQAISELCKKITTAINHSELTDEVKSSVLELTTMVGKHFKEEERLFEPLHLAMEKQHKEEHKVLIGKLASIMEDVDQGRDGLKKKFNDFDDCLQRHISYDFEMKHSSRIPE